MQYYHPDTTQNLSDADLSDAQKEQEQIYQELATCLIEGLPAASARVTALVERWREHRQRYYFDCTLTLMQGFAAVYIADPRHGEFFDTYAPGLAVYFGQAMLAYVQKENKTGAF